MRAWECLSNAKSQACAPLMTAPRETAVGPRISDPAR
jgi:hypothetical protein